MSYSADPFSELMGERRGGGRFSQSAEDPRDAGTEPWRAYGSCGREVAEFLESVPLVTQAQWEEFERWSFVAPSEHEGIALDHM